MRKRYEKKTDERTKTTPHRQAAKKTTQSSFPERPQASPRVPTALTLDLGAYRLAVLERIADSVGMTPEYLIEQWIDNRILGLESLFNE